MAKVFVGLSGGVDSSVTASLLKERGHEVVAVYMKNWTQDLPGMKCPWADDMLDAKRVAVQLDIPFKVYDFQKEYKQAVVDYMVAEYQAGRTPNPDIMCNQEVKFKLFLETALADSADMIATGHYAKTDSTGRLFQPSDESKDQTYFLYRVPAKALSRTLFPLGELQKSDVRAIAHERGLATADKKDSQGICFVGSVGIKEFLSQYISPQVGDIIDKDSHQVIGQHDGAIFYTIGQRHGLAIGGGLPYYVVAKNMAKNQIFVSRNLTDEAMWRKQVELSDIHWISQRLKDGEQFQARMRHRGALLPARLEGSVLKLDQAERAITAGQSAVFYRDGQVFGGGIIQK